MREHVAVRCKPATANGYRHAFDKVLLPAFGSVSLGGIGRDQVAALHYRLHKTPSMANPVVETLSRLFYMAEAWAVARREGSRADSWRRIRTGVANGFCRSRSSAGWDGC